MITNAQKLNLAYEPRGQIVRFYFDSLTIYTDTTSLFSIYSGEGDLKEYDLRVETFVLKKIEETKFDTVTFIGDFIPFNDNTGNKYQNDWYVKWAILQLTKGNRLKLYDKHGQLVTSIITKKVGKRREGYIKRSYINKVTSEELFDETLFLQTITPHF